ncbi:FMRFamide receptor [Plakobranchus ocellatus]|uniref:FMRFamide receptor n=1 Tax=Plakobranchus ocellatus TaxID=259542 RepID=A0AAV4ATX1_9GAST|nr:FMRFamide receptor [Plakobranchus ocellatus]
MLGENLIDIQSVNTKLSALAGAFFGPIRCVYITLILVSIATRYYIVMTLQQINVWITVSVSVERYIAICHPFRAARLITRRNTVTVMIGLAVFSLLYNLPRVFASTTVLCGAGTFEDGAKSHTENITNTSISHDNDVDINVGLEREYLFSQRTSMAAETSTEFRLSVHHTQSYEHNHSFTGVTLLPPPKTLSCLEYVTTEFGQTSFYNFYRTIMYLIIIYVLPFVALLVLNSFLIRELMTMQKRNTNASRKEENEANLSLVLVLIVIVFIFCQTPGLVSQFDIIHFSLFIPWLAFSNFMFTANSAVNFLIYTAFGRKFRRVLLRVCRRISSSYNLSRYRGSSVQFSQAPLQVQKNGVGNGGTLMELSALVSHSENTARTVNVINENQRLMDCTTASTDVGSSDCGTSQSPSPIDTSHALPMPIDTIIEDNDDSACQANCEQESIYFSYCKNEDLEKNSSFTNYECKRRDCKDGDNYEHEGMQTIETEPLNSYSLPRENFIKRENGEKISSIIQNDKMFQKLIKKIDDT